MSEDSSSRVLLASVWFICAVSIGLFLTYKLSRIDNQMYTSGGEYLDIPMVRENRTSQTMIPAEFVKDAQDPRIDGTYGAASGSR